MPKLPSPPAEVPRQHSLTVLAPKFRLAVEAVLADLKEAGWDAMVFETLRTPERQEFLFGFGRTWDDGRGQVTRANKATNSWHAFGLAVDIVQADETPWVAPQGFWQAIGASAKKHGCFWGGLFSTVDLPHVQHGSCPKSPSERDAKLMESDGIEAVWEIYSADA